MLVVNVKAQEYYSNERNEFYNSPDTVLHLEHSLISLSKWESKWHKPFIQNQDNLSGEEIIDYIKFMTISPNNVPDSVYHSLTKENVQTIIDYIKNPMTATWFSDDKDKNRPRRPKKKQIITAEIIYYWMVSLQIPFECQKWHLNRLLTLIRVCNEKNEEQNPDPKRKPSQREMMSRAAALNAQRRAKLNSKG
jgi:hypothetical protein